MYENFINNIVHHFKAYSLFYNCFDYVQTGFSNFQIWTPNCSVTGLLSSHTWLALDMAGKGPGPALCCQGRHWGWHWGWGTYCFHVSQV
jgi:hypothetical protein